MLSRELYKSQDLRVSAFGMCLVNLELGLSIEAIDWLKLEMIREAKEGGILMERELDMVKSKISETKSRYDSASLISLELG